MSSFTVAMPDHVGTSQPDRNLSISDELIWKILKRPLYIPDFAPSNHPLMVLQCFAPNHLSSTVMKFMVLTKNGKMSSIKTAYI